MFDLGADPAAIAAQLGTDPRLRAALRRHPGLRVPGAWDGFELAVRAILGQQVSVRGATTLAGRLAERFGSSVAAGAGGLGRLFPTASQLRDAPIEETGVVRARAEAIRGLARRVAAGTLRLDGPGNAAETLAGCPGIGPWTAAYVGMRAFGEPDAFPAGDLVLCRRAGALPRELERLSQAWRPWRAYAAMLLWQGAADAGMEVRDVRARQAPDDRAGVRARGRVLAGERGGASA
jgi:AraC family transcriptional regulator of adaptative response / DNA-3-methyladenine glycosylase II